MNCTVLGAGAWGSAIALLLSRNGHEVRLWGHDPLHLAEMRSSGRNEKYLPGVEFPGSIVLEPDLHKALAGAGMVVISVPSKALREVVTQAGMFDGLAVSLTKGIEYGSGLTMTGVIKQIWPSANVAALSGPTLASEVARDIPAACVAAAQDESAAITVQEAFHRPAFRVYRSCDVIGVEFGGALKNVAAIAAGVCDGLGFGDNSKAALVTRALVEIRRIGVARGAQPETFSGLSGLGDLMVTCFSRHSRNRAFGERIGKGATVEQALRESSSIAEGYPTSRSAWRLVRELGVEAPVLREVHAMLHEGKHQARAVRDLMERSSKAED